MGGPQPCAPRRIAAGAAGAAQYSPDWGLVNAWHGRSEESRPGGRLPCLRRHVWAPDRGARHLLYGSRCGGLREALTLNFAVRAHLPPGRGLVLGQETVIPELVLVTGQPVELQATLQGVLAV